MLCTHIVGLADRVTHKILPDLCVTLGLPEPPPVGSKYERLRASFDALPDTKVPRLAEEFLTRYPTSAKQRNELQDLLWEDIGPVVPKRFRREVARAIDGVDLYLDARHFDDLLERLWIVRDDLLAAFGLSQRSLMDEIEQHVHRNPGDWSAEMLLDNLGAFDCCDRRFALFLEGLASADVRPDELGQRQFVAAVNEPLRACGVELREGGTDGGYPIFSLVSLAAGSRGRPKNIIFASSAKPDLRFRDAVDNDIEIVTNADHVLVYDRPISTEGLRWRDLQGWWAEEKGLTDSEEAKRSLYVRLKECLPSSSPPQVRFFEGFYRGFGAAVPDLPALLPEVWLHWDPKTVAERGANALLRFRMDFLLLLPAGVRIVVEVDGKHHYADHSGYADPSRYDHCVHGHVRDRLLPFARDHVRLQSHLPGR